MAEYFTTRREAEEFIQEWYVKDGKPPVFFGKIFNNGVEKWIVNYDARQNPRASPAIKVLEDHSGEIRTIVAAPRSAPICPKCGGHGQIERKRERGGLFGKMLGPETLIETCRACNGGGYVLQRSNPATASSPTSPGVGRDRDVPQVSGSNLLKAAQQMNTRLVEELLDAGADPNYQQPSGDRLTCLLVAAGQGANEIVAMLLDRGANIETKDADGWTPLLMAVNRGRPDTVRLLIRRDADVNTSASGVTPLNMIRNMIPSLTPTSHQVGEEITSILKAAGARDAGEVPISAATAIDASRFLVRFDSEATDLAIAGGAFHRGEGAAAHIQFVGEPPELSLVGDSLLIRGRLTCPCGQHIPFRQQFYGARSGGELRCPFCQRGYSNGYDYGRDALSANIA